MLRWGLATNPQQPQQHPVAHRIGQLGHDPFRQGVLALEVARARARRGQRVDNEYCWKTTIKLDRVSPMHSSVISLLYVWLRYQ